MAQQFLNTSQVGSIVEHVGCKAVTQGMRADCRIQSCFNQIFIHFTANTAGAEPFAVFVGKQDLAVKSRVAFHPAIAIFQVMLNTLQGAGTDGADTFFLPLPRI